MALFDCVELPAQTQAGKPKTISVCPRCHAEGYNNEISTRSSEKLGAVPVLVSYECQEGCKPKRGERRHNDADEKKQRFFQEYDLGKLTEIEAKPIPYWTPPQRMMNVESDTAPWGDEWRPGRNFRTVAELFTKRNLWALALLRHQAVSRDAFMFALTGILLNVSRMIRVSNTQFLAGTYYVPRVSKEVNVWKSWSGRIEDLKEIWQSPLALQRNSKLLISTQSASDLSSIRSNSVEYIFTDPPYGGSVQYGELNFVWEAWLNVNTQWHGGEIVVNETRQFTDTVWARQMRDALGECFRVLKPGRWLSLCYHDTSEGTWALIQDILGLVKV